MKPAAKVGVVVVGYLAAVAIACVALSIYVATTAGPDRQTYGAMFAFGDSLYFLGVLGVSAIPATGLGLFFLRPYPAFWRLLSACFIFITALTFVALVVYTARVESPWAALTPLWLLATPFFAAAAFVSGMFAPKNLSRSALIATSLVHGAVFVYIVVAWFRPGAA